MNKKLSNDENIKNLKKRANLRMVIIALLLIVMILSVMSIFYNILLIPTIILFVITKLITKYRESIPINRKDDLEEVRFVINNNKNNNKGKKKKKK